MRDIINNALKRRREQPCHAGRARSRGWAAWPVAGSCLGGLRVLSRVSRACCRVRLRFSSRQCTGSRAGEAKLGADGVWHGFCPCCKRPIEVAFCGRPPKPPRRAEAAGRYAYVAVLWGSKAEYCLGAMVLGRSLRQAAVRHDLVLLYTADIPAAAVNLVARSGWKMREADEVFGVRALYNHGEPRFESVFTKLQVMGLTEYEKVLLLDIDTLVLQNMDDLFNLPAPAAMARGPKHGYKHGDRIEGKYFFGGSSYTRSWGQRSGINAGVMLLAPDSDQLRQMIDEVLDSKHPSHIKGNGPEQDYLSRYWADCWTHIGVEYNFQLHQLFYVLNPDYVHVAERTQFLGDPPGIGIRLVHYSGPLKPWSRFLDPEWASDMGADSNSKFLHATLQSFPGYWLWVLRDRETWSAQEEKEGMMLGSDGRIHRIDWQAYENGKEDGRCAQSQGGSSNANGEQVAFSEKGWPLGEVVEVPEAVVRGAEHLVEHSLTQWREAYEALSAELGFTEHGGVKSLAGQMQVACVPPREEEDEELGEAGEAPVPLQAKQQAAGWMNCGGWWVDQPVTPRAAVLAGRVPERFVTISVQCQTVLNLRGPAAAGAHAVAITEDGAMDLLANGEMSAWAERLAPWPPGTLLLLAIVDPAPGVAAYALAALAGAGCGVPAAPPPEDCPILVAIGRKGMDTWKNTMAAADFALASLPSKG